ncbi:hypothetical protein C8R43DRAFT_1105247 [Mycena crocata]|nr:hypothetical protein C8R43DRAFT_1105247 [Mycena crocata]
MPINIPDSDSPPNYYAEKQSEPKQSASNAAVPRYIYYRVYAPDGSIPSKSPTDAQKPFIVGIVTVPVNTVYGYGLYGHRSRTVWLFGSTFTVTARNRKPRPAEKYEQLKYDLGECVKKQYPTSHVVRASSSVNILQQLQPPYTAVNSTVPYRKSPRDMPYGYGYGCFRHRMPPRTECHGYHSQGGDSSPRSRYRVPETAHALVLRDELTVQERAEVEALGVSGNRGEVPKYCEPLITARGFLQHSQTLQYTTTCLPELGRMSPRLRWFEPYVEERHPFYQCGLLLARPVPKSALRETRANISTYGELYADISADGIMWDGTRVALLQDDSLGCTAENPLVLVQPERRARLFDRPFKVIRKWGVRAISSLAAHSLTRLYPVFQYWYMGYSDGILLPDEVNYDSTIGCRQNQVPR